MVGQRESGAAEAHPSASRVRFGLDGIGRLGAEFKKQMQKEGFAPRESHGYINVDFAKGHRDGDTAQMDRVTLIFNRLLEGVSELPPLRAMADVGPEQEPGSEPAGEPGEASTIPPSVGSTEAAHA